MASLCDCVRVEFLNSQSNDCKWSKYIRFQIGSFPFFSLSTNFSVHSQSYDWLCIQVIQFMPFKILKFIVDKSEFSSLSLSSVFLLLILLVCVMIENATFSHFMAAYYECSLIRHLITILKFVFAATQQSIQCQNAQHNSDC